MKNLLFRSICHRDECILSYLIRISENNGFGHLGHLLHYAGLPWKNTRAPIHQILTGEFDVEPYFNKLGLKYFKSRISKISGSFRNGIDTPYFLVKYPKVCPLCLNENCVCNAEWAYLPILSCTKHKLMLVDTQEKSGRRLSWYRKKMNKFNEYDANVITGLSVPSNCINSISTLFSELSSEKNAYLKNLRY